MEDNQNIQFQLTDALIEQVELLIEQKNDKALKTLLEEFHYADIAEILDQAAKFGLHLQLYHQNLGQLPKDLMVAITSCHTRFVFSGSNPPSAKFLLSGSEKSFEAEDIQDDFKLIESLTQRYFVLKRPEKPLVRAIAPWVHHYEMDLEEVEEYIQEITTPFLTSEQVDKKLSEFTRNLVMKLTPDEPQAKPENDDETAGNAVSEVKEGTATAELADDDLLY